MKWGDKIESRIETLTIGFSSSSEQLKSMAWLVSNAKDNGVIQIAWASLPGRPVMDRPNEVILAFLIPTKRIS